MHSVTEKEVAAPGGHRRWVETGPSFATDTGLPVAYDGGQLVLVATDREQHRVNGPNAERDTARSDAMRRNLRPLGADLARARACSSNRARSDRDRNASDGLASNALVSSTGPNSTAC